MLKAVCDCQAKCVRVVACAGTVKVGHGKVALVLKIGGEYRDFY